MNKQMETVELRIDDVVYQGKGLARHEGKVVFVPGVLPGETVRAEFTHHSKKFSEARLLTVLEPASGRIKPACHLVPQCPGCVYQHIDYADEVALKQKQFVNLLERMAGVSALDCQLPVASPIPLGYRNKIVLHGSTEGTQPVLGYFAGDNTTVLDVSSCPLARPELNALLATTRGGEGFRKSIRNEVSVTFRFTQNDGAVCWSGKHKANDSWLTESTEVGDVKVPRGSFFQVNPAVAEVLISDVVDLIGRAGCEFVVDLYCGVGVFSLAAVAAGIKQVIGVDLDPEGIEAAIRNAQVRRPTGMLFKADTAQRGLQWALKKVDPSRTMVVVDPPRAGMEGPVLERLAVSKPAGILYISCAADTMARDVKQLKKAGYQVKNTRLYDMFPRTPYFESLTLLTLE